MKRLSVILILCILFVSAGCGNEDTVYSSDTLSFTASPGTVITEEEGCVCAQKGELSVRITTADAVKYASEDAAEWDRERLDLKSGAYAGTFGNSWFIYEFFKYMVPEDAFCAPPSETSAGADGLCAYTSAFEGDGYCGEITETVKNGTLILLYVRIEGTDPAPCRDDIDRILNSIDI